MSADEDADDVVVLRDPRAIKALAHPARLSVIDRLFGGEVLTATECAAVAGLTPSAMSYHLRALERWGIVARAAPAGDGRERPWRAAGRSLHIDRTAMPAGSAPAELLLQQSVAQLGEAVASAARRRSAGETDLPMAFLRASERLTREEFTELTEALEEFLERYAGRTPPEGARRFSFFWAVTPDDR